MKFNLLYSIIFSIFIFTTKLTPCTGVLINSIDNSIVTGRTVEFATKLAMSVAVIPRNYNFQATSENGPGMTYTSKYAAAGVYCFESKILMDGINEKGLVASAFFFPGYASYSPTTVSNQKTSMSPVDFTNWILTQFSTIDEVTDAVKLVSIAPTVLQGWGSAPPPFHYVIYDSTGKSIVIEPLDGELIVYENLIGTITNSPTYDWHLTNLNNYINLTTFNINPIMLRGLKLQSFGQGSGLHGMPGDFSSPSRFVRASIFSSSFVPPENAANLPNQTFHVLNAFDIPLGSVREKSNGSTSFDYTQLTTVKDPNSLRYYYKSYSGQTVKYLDLNQFNLNSQSIVDLKINDVQNDPDISSLLK